MLVPISDHILILTKKAEVSNPAIAGPTEYKKHNDLCNKKGGKLPGKIKFMFICQI
jgi:hypothetical protein